MGVVYRAYQRSLDREVAIKVLRPGEAGLGPWMARFVDEARHLARLRHQNIVSVHEIGEAGGEPFFAMDLVKGESLAARLSHGPITTAQALHWALQVGEAVQFAHESGVMHRDLKPANILLDENGRAFVSDFGLARELSGDSSHTRPGEVLGTPAYMAREQALGDSDRIGERSDVHGLAVVIYEMLCGKAPYGCGAPGQVLSKLLAGDYVPLRKENPRVPRELETVVHKAMSPDVEQRYPTMSAFLDDLRRARDGVPVLARRPGPLRKTLAFARRQRKTILAAACAAIVAGASVWAFADGAGPVERAEAHRSAGDHRAAVRTWVEAFESLPQDAAPAQRAKLLSEMREDCLAIKSHADAMDAAISVLKLDPDAGLGDLDVYVALELAERVQSAQIRRSPILLDMRDLARHRVNLALQAKGLDSKARVSLQMHKGLLRLPTEEELHASAPIRDVPRSLLAMSEDPEDAPRDLPKHLQRKPATIESLEEIGNDSKISHWTRARARFQLARILEDEGRREEAIQAARASLEVMRHIQPAHSITPSHAGVITHELGLPISALFDIRLSALRWLNLRAGRAVTRLDPEAKDPLAASIHLPFVVDAKDAAGMSAGLPEGYGIDLSFALVPVDADGQPAGEAREEAYSKTATLRGGANEQQRVEVGVLPGRYALMGVQGQASPGSEELQQLQELFAFDSSGLPEIITVGEGVLELPPIRIWRRHELRLQAPAVGAKISSKDAFRWQPVPGAVRYKVLIDKTVEGFRWGSIAIEHETQDTQLVLADHPEIWKKLVNKRHDYWTVEAFDAKGRRIGLTRKSELKRPFVVWAD
jgi:tetratricopeptide (TPR) repeat protein